MSQSIPSSIDVSTFCKILRVSRNTAYAAIRSGQVPSEYIPGRGYLIPTSYLGFKPSPPLMPRRSPKPEPTWVDQPLVRPDGTHLLWPKPVRVWRNAVDTEGRQPIQRYWYEEVFRKNR